MNMQTTAAAWRVAALTRLAAGELSTTLDESDTAQWVEAAAGCGIAEAQMTLGHMLLAGDGIGPDPRAAFACFLCAADNGDAGAMPCWDIAWKMAGARKRISRPPSCITAALPLWAMQAR